MKQKGFWLMLRPFLRIDIFIFVNTDITTTLVINIYGVLVL